MRKIYIAVAMVLVMSVALFIASFAYLDRSKHRSYDFTVNFESRAIGTIRIDKFITDDKIIYKSVSDIPFAPVYTETRSRLDLDKRHALDSYEKEMVEGRAEDLVYIRNSNGLVSFVAKYRSGFSFVDNIPTKKETFVFDEDSPMTYMPIVENYDFTKGRSQVFNALICQRDLALPPRKKILTLTSIKDEYLKIDSRKIKTENLILKMRDYPQIAIWVAKSDRAIIRIEMPEKRLVISRSFKPVAIRASAYAPQDPRYMSKEAVFKSGGVELSGTLTLPTRDGKFPAVLLVPGSSPADRDMEGLFASLADSLSKSGMCVLRYDKRGIGKSKGDPAISTASEEVQDAAAALEHLKAIGSVDPARIAVAGYGKGSLYAMRLCAERDGIRGLILISPELCMYGAYDQAMRAPASATWPDDYAALVARTAQMTAKKVSEAKGAWTGILGVRCYTNKMREEACVAPADVIAKIGIPVLILEGGSSSRESDSIHRAFIEAANTGCTLTTFDGTGAFLGALVNDGTHRLHYEMNDKVLDAVKAWLEKAFMPPVQAPQESQSAPK